MKHLAPLIAAVGLLAALSAHVAVGAGATMNLIHGAPPAEDFTLPDPSGRQHSLSDYGDKVVMINFWATWCAPCRKEMPAMEQLYRDLRDEGLEILAVHAGPGGQAMHEFLEEIPVSFPVLVDADLELSGWDVTALPTTVLVDREGRRVYGALGPREWDSEPMKAFLREIIERR